MIQFAHFFQVSQKNNKINTSVKYVFVLFYLFMIITLFYCFEYKEKKISNSSCICKYNHEMKVVNTVSVFSITFIKTSSQQVSSSYSLK